MIDLRTREEVRAAEQAHEELLSGALMQRAATALAVVCVRLLAQARGAVPGSRVVLLVGSGDNGGDALFAGARLADRGCDVTALVVGDAVHSQGQRALTRSGGRAHRVTAIGNERAAEIVGAADLLLDGVVGIGGSGPLRDPAATLAAHAADEDVTVVAVDIPSGVDADTGEVVGAAVVADVTVTFGAIKPGAVVAPGALHSGTVRVVDIGLQFSSPAKWRTVEDIDVARWVPEEAADTHKYRRGVVGIAAGSPEYPGAGLLATAAARRGNVGMVRFLDRGNDVSRLVVAQFPDVVIDGSPPTEQTGTSAWVCGPGFSGTADDDLAVAAVLECHLPVVIDAGALALIAPDAPGRQALLSRAKHGYVTVVTPHEGEFARMFPGLVDRAGRLDAARRAAADLGSIVVLKGPGTIIAGPDGSGYVDTAGTAALGTAGSGDVLSGLIGAVLAGAWHRGQTSAAELAEATAAAVWIHGTAGSIAAQQHPVVTAPDVIDAIPAAVGWARFGPPASVAR